MPMPEDHFRKFVSKLDASEPIGTTILKLHKLNSVIETQLYEELLKILGCTLDNCPFQDIRLDDYDESIELQGANMELYFTDEQWGKVALLGFKRGWIVHFDGSERAYPGDIFKPWYDGLI